MQEREDMPGFSILKPGDEPDRSIEHIGALERVEAP
jgi:hypothetical protein